MPFCCHTLSKTSLRKGEVVSLCSGMDHVKTGVYLAFRCCSPKLHFTDFTKMDYYNYCHIRISLPCRQSRSWSLSSPKTCTVTTTSFTWLNTYLLPRCDPDPPRQSSSPPPPPHTSLLQLPCSTCGCFSSIPFINSFLMLPDGMTVIHGDLRAVVRTWVCRCSYPQNLCIASGFVCVL